MSYLEQGINVRELVQVPPSTHACDTDNSAPILPAMLATWLTQVVTYIPPRYSWSSFTVIKALQRFKGETGVLSCSWETLGPPQRWGLEAESASDAVSHDRTVQLPQNPGEGLIVLFLLGAYFSVGEFQCLGSQNASASLQVRPQAPPG